MTDAPTPVYIDPKKFETNKPVEPIQQAKTLEKKEYELKYDDKIYNLEIKIDSDYIYFRIYENKDNSIQPIFYKNKFDLKTIAFNLKLYPEVYNSLDKVFSLINDAYNPNKITLSIKNNKMNIIIKVTNGNIEIDCPINLDEAIPEIDDKFEIVICNINILKTNINNLANKKILEIEKIIKDVQILTNKKLEENENKIKELSNKVDKYNSQFEKNENNIKSLQNELSEIKKLLNKTNKIDNFFQEGNSFDTLDMNNEEEKKNNNNKQNSENNNNNNNDNNETPFGNNDIYEEIETPQEKSPIKNVEKEMKRNKTGKGKKNNNSSFCEENENKNNMLHKSVQIPPSFMKNKERRDSAYDDNSANKANKKGKGFHLFFKKNSSYSLNDPKRQLVCIMKEVNDPINSIIDIPKFKIFNGFQKKIIKP